MSWGATRKRKDHPIKPHGLVWTLGRYAVWLRDKYILLAITLGAAICVAVLVFASDSEGAPLSWAPRSLLAAAIAAALASAADKFADRHAKKEEKLSQDAASEAGVRAVVRLIALLENLNQVARSRRATAQVQMPNVRLAAAALASEVPSAENVRASYYALTRDADGKYQLVDPVTQGRPEDAVTEFRAADDPGHSIWQLLATPDKNCKIRNDGDAVPDFDWTTKRYKTFVTLPVRAGTAVFGMLTANALNPGDLTELDRVALIAAARTLALAEAAATADVKTRDDISELKSLGTGSIDAAGRGDVTGGV